MTKAKVAKASAWTPEVILGFVSILLPMISELIKLLKAGNLTPAQARELKAVVRKLQRLA